jgi:hypothetical protein
MYWVLVVWIIGSGSAVHTLPHKYATQAKCDAAGKAWKASQHDSQSFGYSCVPAY